ncbi:hypothetical protein HPG69_003660 [Diceros bicornis minor]|uniref:Coiled-coil domain-containing protein 102B n=1 Tax=Diceros bicornis minor TaxID=77932 RepID=A0A7J7ET80_DICBM|nr:hypothetical protein HPG69_003660 [Diceros bicornis minor]
MDTPGWRKHGTWKQNDEEEAGGVDKPQTLHTVPLSSDEEIEFTQSSTPENIHMNLDSIHRLIEETQIFQMQQSSVKPTCDVIAPASSHRDTCNSCVPLYGLQSHAAHDLCAHSRNTNEWDICEELRLRELEEVKARAAQMEKTMRWWSDCTANWREKWSKVRTERNSAREEGRQLRIKLEMTMKELSALKKKQSLPHQKEVLEARVTQDLKRPSFIEVSCAQRDQFQMGSKTCESIRECLLRREFPTKENTTSKEEGLIIDPSRLNEEMKLNLDCSDLFKNGGSENCAVTPGLRPQAMHLPLENEAPEMAALQVHLDEFQKILWKEREMRLSLEKEIGRLESALSVWKWKYEELKESKTKSMKEIMNSKCAEMILFMKSHGLENQIFRHHLQKDFPLHAYLNFNILHSQHENEMEEIPGDIKEGSKSQNNKDRVIYELRAEVILEDVLNTNV